MLYKFLKSNEKLFFMECHTKYLKIQRNYEKSIKMLNGLITNANSISKSLADDSKSHLENIPKTRIFCERAGIKICNIDRLKIIHVAGTKGKGSTCGYIETILRRSGMKTGLFTSPHLKEVRERIKINGVPISIENFNNYFWNVYDSLSATKNDPNDMPFYFQFLTIMAFNVFLKEKVDFVVLETGIGGRYDNTNIISNPVIVCITSLGYDHMEILGSTMSNIAWNKAGIIKPRSVVFTCDSQPKEGLGVIENEVNITNSTLYLVPTLGYKMLEISEEKICVHQENALLASAICQMILDQNFVHSFLNDSNRLNKLIKISPEVCLSEEHKKIIYSTPIMGRYQIIRKSTIDYYIDGAHTMESLKTSVKWFQKVTKDRRYDKRFLIFMTTGNRSTENLLFQLMVLQFDGILLSPLIAFTDKNICDFAVNSKITEREKIRMVEIAETWKRLSMLSVQDNKKELIVENFQSFSDIVNWLNRFEHTTIQVLVVGSLHLVGCALTVLS